MTGDHVHVQDEEQESLDSNQLIRVTSVPPERENLKFQVPTLVGAPSEVFELVQHIQIVAERFLYHWKTFPIVLPVPILQASSTDVSSSPEQNRKSRAINLRDLFIAPPFDELDAVATDSHGEPRRLTFNQLRSLRERGLQKDKQGKAKILNQDQLGTIRLRGEFEVPSLNFSGQVHKWKLSQFLQKGTDCTYDTLLCDLALSARFIVVTARARIVGHFFSVKNAAKSLVIGLLKICNALVGLPSLLAQDLDHKLIEERCRFLVAELECRPGFEDYLDTLTSYVRKELRRAETEKYEMECPALPIPYLFLTPKGQEIDLRLFSKDVMRKALPIVHEVLEKESRGWFLHFRERLIAELREKKLSDQDIQEEVNDAAMREYLQRVYNSILTNDTLKSLGEGIPELLVQQAQSVVIMNKALNKIHREINIVREDHTQDLHETYPILSRVPPWLRSKQNAAVSMKVQDSTWSAHEEAINECAKHNLQQSIYFLNRDLAFTKEREPVLLKELKDAKTPTRNFQWPCRIWSPRSWIIRRNFQGKSEQIPTVISQQTTSIVTPRSDPSQPVFLVEKEVSRTTSTRWPFWRLLNIFMRSWCWTWNLVFLLGVFVPWYSPVGLRALFSIPPFMSDLELSQINGTLFPRKTSITQTMASRLLDLWRDISKSRSHFESKPDTGFVGKGITRNLNRVWNYGVKGFLGTLMIVILFPVACLTVTTLGLLFAITAPIWVPIISICLHIFIVLVYDIDCPDEKRNRFGLLWEALILNIVVEGLLQPVFALLVAVILCPISTAVIGFVGAARYGLRMCWDFITYHVFIKKYGRVPATDSFAVQRIEGPGLNANYFFLIKPEQALAAFEAKMELDELQAYQKAVEEMIRQPQKDFTKFVDVCFGSFSAQLSNSGAYKELEKESKELLGVLNEKLEKRKNELQIGLPLSSRTKIKMKTVDLKIAIQQSAHLLERFYPQHVISRSQITMDEFWDAKNLTAGDWAGLAGTMYVDMFSIDFLTPIADDETTFNLEQHTQLNLSRYTEMVQSASDLLPDILGNLYAPRGNIQIKSPFLEVTAFNPRSKVIAKFRNRGKKSDSARNTLLPPSSSSVRSNKSTLKDAQKKFWPKRPWKRDSTCSTVGKLSIPLTIPHPAHVAILIHNRDTEQPIPMDQDIFWDILKSIEDCQELIERSHPGNRYRDDADKSTDCHSSQESIASQTSDGSRFSSNDSLDGMAGTSETLPCGGGTVRGSTSRPTIDLGAIGTGRTVRWTLNNNDNGSSQGNDIVIRFSDGVNGGVNTVRVDLASPEDISLGTDSSRAVYGGAFGSGV